MKAFLTILCALPTLMGFTQESKLKLIGRAYQRDSIVLRWSPVNYTSWQAFNNMGYTLVRYTISRGDERYKVPVRKVLEEEIRAKKAEKWQKLINKDDFAAIYLQAFIGEEFSSSSSALTNRIVETTQRFSFAMLMADLSEVTASYGGLRFCDEDIQPEESYIYEIISGEDTTRTFLQTDEIYPTPPPYNIEIESGDKTVILRWNGHLYRSVYSAYEIQKFNRDNGAFEPLSEMPLISTGERGDYVKLDSVTENGQKYRYRIRGITPFSDFGDWSDTLEIAARKPFTATVAISNHEIEEGAVKIYWKNVNSEKVTSFSILKSPDSQEGFTKVVENLSADKTTWTDRSPFATNFYRITAHGPAEDPVISHPYMVVFPDSIPPAVPENMRATVDTTGVVSLFWKHVTEADLLGYRVFKGYNPEDEFVEVTKSAVRHNVFTDTLSLKNLNRKIYYALRSEDKRFNKSILSKPLKVILPDIVPPMSPVFKGIRTTSGANILSWSGSPSKDVEFIYLYRKAEEDSLWTEILVTKNIAHTFSDSTIKKTSAHYYTLIAKDSSGNESAPAKPVKSAVYLPAMGKTVNFDDFTIDRSSGWVYLRWPVEENTLKYLIYRGEGDEQLTTYSALSGKTEFHDKKVKPGSIYRYALKAIYQNGTETQLSKPITINY